MKTKKKECNKVKQYIIDCQIADYWSQELGKNTIHAFQASKRGGHLYCKLLENRRISISGEATLVAISELAVDF